MVPSSEEPLLSGLDGAPVGACTLAVVDVRVLRRSGWRSFSLCLRDSRGTIGLPPVIHGIVSRGGKDGVKPWMDIDYRGEIPFEGGEPLGSLISLREEGMDRRIFTLLGVAIPPGGHLMVAYEGDQEIHRETLLSLAAGVPPAATPLGHLLVFGGFLHVKDWYLAEGGMEGPRKLWGEKAVDPGWERTFGEWTRRQLLSFLATCKSREGGPLLESAGRRAEEILRRIREGRA
jgi:hypothetical protein